VSRKRTAELLQRLRTLGQDVRTLQSRLAIAVAVEAVSNRLLAMSRRLLKFSGGSVDDYATFSTSTTRPSC
jgi:hypothetical protein